MTTAPIQESNDQQSAKPTKNIFEDPAIQEAAKNDAFVRFVLNNWRSLLALLVAVGVSMIAYTSYTTTSLNKRAAATAQLSEVQASYKALLDMQDDLGKTQAELASTTDQAQKTTLTATLDKKNKEIADSRAKLSLVIDSLDPAPPFGTLGQLYRGLVAGRFGDYDGVLKAIAAIPVWSSISDKESSPRFVAETAALGLAKSLAQSEQHQQQAKEQLRALAENGSFVAVEALGALSGFAKTPEEVATIKGLAENVKARFPSQEQFFSDINERLATQESR